MPKHTWRGFWVLRGVLAFAVACSSAQLTQAPPFPEVETPATQPNPDAGKTGNPPIVVDDDAGVGEMRPEGRLTVYVQPDEKADSILRAMAGARKSLYVQMYLLSGYKFQNAILNAKRRGVDVKVILNKTFPNNGEANNDGNNTIFDKLTAAGVPTVWGAPRYPYTHSKMVLIDGVEVWIMSMNMTVTSPTTNREFIVVDRDADDVAEAQQIFDADYVGRHIQVAGRLLLSPSDSTPVDASTRLIALIASAKTKVMIAGSDISDGEICRALMSAKGRGVDVRVLFDAQTMNPNESEWANTFKAAGLSVKGMRDPDLHAKVIVADDARAYLGSINFTRNSLFNNREVGLIFSDASEVAKVVTTLDKDWNAAGPL